MQARATFLPFLTLLPKLKPWQNPDLTSSPPLNSLPLPLLHTHRAHVSHTCITVELPTALCCHRASPEAPTRPVRVWITNPLSLFGDSSSLSGFEYSLSRSLCRAVVSHSLGYTHQTCLGLDFQKCLVVRLELTISLTPSPSERSVREIACRKMTCRRGTLETMPAPRPSRLLSIEHGVKGA